MTVVNPQMSETRRRGGARPRRRRRHQRWEGREDRGRPRRPRGAPTTRLGPPRRDREGRRRGLRVSCARRAGAENLLQPTNGVEQRQLSDAVPPDGRAEGTGPGNRPRAAQTLRTESVVHASSLRTLASGPARRPVPAHREPGRPRTGQPGMDRPDGRKSRPPLRVTGPSPYEQDDRCGVERRPTPNPTQALGRLPWLAPDLARARRLRPRLPMKTASPCLDSPHEGAYHIAILAHSCNPRPVAHQLHRSRAVPAPQNHAPWMASPSPAEPNRAGSARSDCGAPSSCHPANSRRSRSPTSSTSPMWPTA